MTSRDAAIYGHYLKRPGHLRATMEWYRAFNQDVADNAVYAKTKLTNRLLAFLGS